LYSRIEARGAYTNLRLPTVPPSKRLKRFLRYWAIRGALALLSLLPIAWASALGGAFGALAYPFAKRERARAAASLAQAFPELPETSRRALTRAAFRHFGRAAFELSSFPRKDRTLGEVVEWPPEERAAFEVAFARRKGVVMVTAHLGNWELLGRAVSLAFQPFFAVGKETNDPRLTRDIHAFRWKVGAFTAWRGEPGSAKVLLRGLRAGGVLMVLIDQDTKVSSMFVPFFGKLASTPRAAADFALRTGAAVIGAYCLRQGGARYRLFTHEVPFQPTGDREADALSLTAALTKDIEEAIRRAPAQWVWWHERWKTRP
jgi:Kdo2-lipid IVA lauroyltransferase/acyltransferase